MVQDKYRLVGYSFYCLEVTTTWCTYSCLSSSNNPSRGVIERKGACLADNINTSRVYEGEAGRIEAAWWVPAMTFGIWPPLLSHQSPQQEASGFAAVLLVITRYIQFPKIMCV